MYKKGWLLVLVLMVAAMLGACSNGGGSGAGASGGVSRDTLGTSTILATGGTGTEGGFGGFFGVLSYNMKGVTLSKYGTVDTTFTVPTLDAAPINFGANSVTISSNTTVTVLDSGAADPGAGVLYLVDGYHRLYMGTGTPCCTVGELADQGRQEVSGLKVDAGATLTLGLNYSTTNWNYALDYTSIYFTNDLDIAGTVKPSDLTSAINLWDYDIEYRHGDPATSRDMGAITFQAENIFVRSTGVINTVGSAGTTSVERGGDGGYIHLYANSLLVQEGALDCSGGAGFGTDTIGGNACATSGWGGEMWIESDGQTINKGTLTANGGTGAYGGQANYIELWANSFVYNTGSVTANGGTGTNGNGGNGYAISLFSSYASLFNSGALIANGGDGLYEAGDGGGYGDSTIYLAAGYYGSGNVTNSGGITANGGSITAGGYGIGGNGGEVYIEPHGALKQNGSVTMNGGTGRGNAGGDGGIFRIIDFAPSTNSSSSELPVTLVEIAGNISVCGGLGNTGGAGGEIEVGQAPTGRSAGDATGGIHFLGYTTLNVSGGDGTSVGGAVYSRSHMDTDDVMILTMSDHNPSDIYNWDDRLPAGPVVNEVDIIARGGNASDVDGEAAKGGVIFISSGVYGNNDMFDVLISNVTNSFAKLDVSGGSGGSTSGSGGDSGAIAIFAQGGSIVNSGELDLLGGSGFSAGRGAFGGSVYIPGAYDGTWGVGGLDIEAGADITNTGAIIATGGAGSSTSGSISTGGSSNSVYFYAGGVVTNSGGIMANGGDGNRFTGSGGQVWLGSETAATVNTGTINVTAGTDNAVDTVPNTVGTIGTIWLDEVDVTPATGIL